jgi:cell wall-associated NlpC family hydrolase
MPSRHSLLSTLALVTSAAAVAVFVPVPLTAPTGVDTASAATPLGHPNPTERPPQQAPPPSLGERAAKIAVGMVGVPYRWGGESPSGFDCSGLVRWTYLRVGVELPHSSYALYGLGRTVSRSQIEPGDMLFFEGLGHVGLYLGRGRMVHAPYSGRNVEVVRLADWYGSRLVGARRLAF